jgi:hypothetical protein
MASGCKHRAYNVTKLAAMTQYHSLWDLSLTSGHRDEALWRLSADGHFSVRSAY